jgi:hypothetical protein
VEATAAEQEAAQAGAPVVGPEEAKAEEQEAVRVVVRVAETCRPLQP